MSLRGVRGCSAASRTGHYPSLPAAEGDLPSGRLILAFAQRTIWRTLLSARGESGHVGLACEPHTAIEGGHPAFMTALAGFFVPQSEGCVN